MPLSYELKQLLRANAAKEPEQVTARNSQALRLNLDGRQVTLVNRMGASTEAGRYFYRTVRKQPLPDSRWDDDVPTFRKPGGRTDYVKTRANQEVALRTWNPAKKEFDYTAAGRSFYERRPRQYIVQVPVRACVKRRTGDMTSYTGTYPATDLSEEIRDGLKGVV